jgi:hypothetical protein
MSQGIDEARIAWTQSEALADFRRRIPPLDAADQTALVAAAADMLAAHYAHLPQKRERHHVNAPELVGSVPPHASALCFHAALAARFAALRDLHTTYVLPPPFFGHIAFLPFQVGWLRTTQTGRLIVTHVVQAAVAAPFGPGCEILTFDGIEVVTAIAALAELSGGANPPARWARAVAALTQRPMQRMAPPDRCEVMLGYRPPGASMQAPLRHLRFSWRVAEILPDMVGPVAPATSPALSLDAEGDALRQHRRRFYAPHILAAERAGAAPSFPAHAEDHPFEAEIATALTALRAWAGRSGDRRFGHLRIRSFKTEDADGWLDEVARLLRLLPQERLILDVRDNSGGLVDAAERLLPMLSDTRIAPMRMQFLATPENLALCRQQGSGSPDLSAWVDSLAAPAGSAWSAALPMTSPDLLRDTPRIYPGQVVLVTSALCYSACDIFIAGFADHGIGPILGVDENIGAGGANVWSYRQLMALRGRDPDLPGGAGLRVAIRRALRRNGQPLEELGVIPTHLHHPTRRDLLAGDHDLLHAALALFEQTEVAPGGTSALAHDPDISAIPPSVITL